jgi:hypothetical protein
VRGVLGVDIPPIAHNLAVFSKSASSSTTAGPLPPNSIKTGFKYLAQTCPILLPTAALPMKSTFRTALCAIMASVTAAASDRTVCTTLMTPAGIPASSRHSTRTWCVRGQSSDALTTMVQPAARAMLIARRGRIMAPFHLYSVSL